MSVIAEVAVEDNLADARAPMPDRRGYRINSIDILRGLVIVLMALDHVRDYLMLGSTQDPTADPTTGPFLFATRWITHLCAPTFVFLSGVCAGLTAHRKSPSNLARFLLLRGLWLIALEVLVVSTAASFSPLGTTDLGGRTYVGLQVIWAIGTSMVVLAGVQWLGARACFAIGAVIILGHNLLDPVWPAETATGAGAPVWIVLHTRQIYEAGPLWIYFSYPVLPWIGVMLVGYACAGLFRRAAKPRDQRLTWIGTGLLLAFLLARGLDVYGDPRHWDVHVNDFAATVMSFLATTKYPPSLLYLLVTLGSAAIVCAHTQHLPDGFRHVLLNFGRSPLAFYVAHLYLIHTGAILLGIAQGFAAEQFLTLYRFFPKGYGVGLGGVYLAWITVVAILYPLCSWVTALKARQTDWWLSYL